MPKHKLTKKYVDGLPLAKEGQQLYWDTEIKGFGVCVGKQSKSYMVQRDVKGRGVRCTIGKHGVYSAEQARKQAALLLQEMAQGVNQNHEKAKAKIIGSTLDEIYKQFLNDAKQRMSDNTLRGYNWHMRSHFEDWQRLPLTDITKDMVVKRHQEITESSGKVSANNALKLIRTLFNHAMIDNDELLNPVDILSRKKLWHSNTRRQTIIREHQLPAWYQGVINQPNTTVRDALLFMLFTGLRKMEAFTLKWDDVDLEGKTFRIIHTKNKQELELPLSDYLLAMLKERYAHKGVNEYVFDGTGKEGHLVEPKKVIKVIIEESGVQFMLHDLRRTFITTAERLDISAYALKRLVNHKNGSDVTEGYIIMDVERLREPMQRIADYYYERCLVQPHS